jgi:molybdopterin-guanine dinucleotide biosynthesis protein A
VPCDTPLFPTDLVARMAALLSAKGADIAIAGAREADGALRAQPVFCLMHVRVQESLVRFTEGGGRKIDTWTAQNKAILVPFDRSQDGPRCFFNANTLEELQQLEADTP